MTELASLVSALCTATAVAAPPVVVSCFASVAAPVGNGSETVAPSAVGCAADGLPVEDNDYWCNVGHYSTASATSQKSSVPAPDLSAANQIGSLGRRNRS